jgi:hypothetical protein
MNLTSSKNKERQLNEESQIGKIVWEKIKQVK